MVEMTDHELLSQLGDVLTVSSVKPDDVTMARLYATLTELENDTTITVLAPVAPKPSRRSVGRTLSTRGSFLAVAASVLFLTAGVAAAAVATNTLPGVTRNIAYDLGLPVTSPGLVQTQEAVSQLQSAIAHQSPSLEKQWGTQVERDLQTLSAGDLTEISTIANTLLGDVGLTPPIAVGGSSPTTVPGTTPTISVPGVTVPGATVPGVTVPTVTTPTVTIPIVSVPGVSSPGVTTPPLTVPSISVPSVTVPSVSIPPVTIPKVTIPPVTIPIITIPPLKTFL